MKTYEEIIAELEVSATQHRQAALNLYTAATRGEKINPSALLVHHDVARALQKAVELLLNLKKSLHI